MFRRSFTMCLVFAVLSAAATMKIASAGDQVPFSGKLEGAYTRTGVYPKFHIEPKGIGNATHLGRFQFEIPHDVDVSLTPAGGTGTFVFKAANGDTVFGTFSTSATPVPGMPGFIYAIEPMTILGGTGRFANATGSFQCERLVDTFRLTSTGSFKGTISRPNR